MATELYGVDNNHQTSNYLCGMPWLGCQGTFQNLFKSSMRLSQKYFERQVGTELCEAQASKTIKFVRLSANRGWG